MKLEAGDIGSPYAQIYLDDVYQNACIMADQEKGVIQRYVCDENGKVILKGIRKRYRTEFVKGVVRIEFKNVPLDAAELIQKHYGLVKNDPT